jgi:hypothetical protein
MDGVRLLLRAFEVLRIYQMFDRAQKTYYTASGFRFTGSEHEKGYGDIRCADERRGNSDSQPDGISSFAA